jgi:tetratricopeptide (TPR) repeat protein
VRHWLCVAWLSVLLPFGASAEDLTKCLNGWSATQSGDHLGAVVLFKECVRDGQLSEASLARTYRNIGIAYRRAKEPNRAIESYNKSIAMNPVDIADDYLNRGNAYDEAGRFKEAMADYDKALELRPGYGEVFYNRGITYEHQEQFDKAKAEFIAAYDHGLRTSLLGERFAVYDLPIPSSSPAAVPSGGLRVISEARNDAVGFALTLKLSTGSLAEKCQTLGGRFTHNASEVLAGWKNRNMSLIDVADKYLTYVRLRMEAQKGEQAGREFIDELKAMFVRDAQGSMDDLFPAGKVDAAQCQRSLDHIAQGAMDLSALPAKQKILEEIRADMASIDQ